MDRKQYEKEYKLKNKEKITEYMKQYYLKNRERITAQRLAKRQAPEAKARLKEYHAEYHKKNPHKSRQNRRRRRALERKNATHPYTETQVLDLYGSLCHICGMKIDLQAPRIQGKSEGWEYGLHIDHLIPISSGGADSIENVRPAHAVCNLKKSWLPPIQIVTQERVI